MGDTNKYRREHGHCNVSILNTTKAKIKWLSKNDGRSMLRQLKAIVDEEFSRVADGQILEIAEQHDSHLFLHDGCIICSEVYDVKKIIIEKK